MRLNLALLNSLTCPTLLFLHICQQQSLSTQQTRLDHHFSSPLPHLLLFFLDSEPLPLKNDIILGKAMVACDIQTSTQLRLGFDES